MYGRRGKVRISCKCMGEEERYESSLNLWEEEKGTRISCECMEGEERYEWGESSVNVWEERKGTNQL